MLGGVGKEQPPRLDLVNGHYGVGVGDASVSKRSFGLGLKPAERVVHVRVSMYEHTANRPFVVADDIGNSVHPGHHRVRRSGSLQRRWFRPRLDPTLEFRAEGLD